MSISLSRIMVPVDGSPQSIVAFRAATHFAKKLNAQLTALHIHENNKTAGELRQTLHAENAGVDFHYLHREGAVYKEIIATSKESDTELIVMGTHGVSGFEEFWMGSNAYKVVNSSTCPVLTMREDAGINQFKSIVLPIDTSFESRQKVPYAIKLAEVFGATVHLLGVSTDNNKEAEYKVNAYLRQTIDKLNEHHINSTHEKRLGGNITNQTIRFAQEKDADLIVIMTEQELQIGSFFLGKYAQQMVNHSNIPVLSIPPREDLMVTEARL
jgi:nucleotide-binding universal stress UspA family protein